MSARDELAHELVNGRIAHRGALAECEREVGEALDAYRAEVLREARKEIIEASLATPDLKAREAWKSGYKAGLSMAAVICMPDTP